jgi:hypothetical protein
MSTYGELDTPINGLVNFICAVLEIGKNSVIPSIMARIIACIKFIYDFFGPNLKCILMHLISDN